jgi:hypothetical protein
MLVIAGMILAPPCLSACGNEREGRESTPGAHDINLQTMTYAGIGIGATIADVRAAYGDPESTETPAAPAGADRMRGPMSIPLPDTVPTEPPLDEPPPLLRYREVAFLTDGMHVFAVLIEDPEAVTEKAVSVGDDLERADAEYGLTCTTARGWSEDDVYPACFGRLGGDRYVWFGGDPIENVSFGNVPLTTGGEAEPTDFSEQGSAWSSSVKQAWRA